MQSSLCKEYRHREKIQKSARKSIQIQKFNLRFALMRPYAITSILSLISIALKVSMMAQNNMTLLKALGNVKAARNGLN